MTRETHRIKTLPVKIRYSFMRILTGSDLSLRRLPMMSAISKEPGPVVWLTACAHGDEICGIVIAQEIFKRIRRKLRRGSIYAFPLMNPLGFETGTRNISMSSEDLNRSFPGDPNGSLGERIADRILKSIMETKPDLVLDLHTDWVQSIPYTIIDHDPGAAYKLAYQKSKAFAKQAGIVSILEGVASPHSLSDTFLKNDVPALTFELGEPHVINEENVERGLRAIWNILMHLDMADPPEDRVPYDAPQTYGGKVLNYSDRPYSSKSGIIRFLAKPGDEVKKGQPFAKIVNVFGRQLETVSALNDGIVLGHSDSSVVFPGMPIMAFGVH